MDVKVKIFGKQVNVSAADDVDLKTAFNQASSFVNTLMANGQIRDLEAGINPAHATHQIVKEANGDYSLCRIRFHGMH